MAEAGSEDHAAVDDDTLGGETSQVTLSEQPNDSEENL